MSKGTDAYVKRIVKLCSKQIEAELVAGRLKAELAGGWDFTVSKSLALFLIDSEIINDNKNGCIMNKEYGQDNNEEDDMWNGVTKEDMPGLHNEEYENFAISMR
jgi:hypothetical protein